MKLSQSIQLLQGAAAANTSFSRNQKGISVRALQMLLYSLGYATDLNWDKYRADGGYGGSSTAAVKAWLTNNGQTGNGETVDGDMLKTMLAQQAAIPALKSLKQHLAANTVEQLSEAHLATLLTAMGIRVEPGQAAAALNSLATKLGAPLSGGQLSQLAAKAIITQISKGLGAGWEKAGEEGHTTRRIEDHQVVPRKKGVKVLGDWLGVNFNKAKLGVWTMGEALPSEFIEQYTDTLVERGMTPSAVRVLLPVSANEGNLDAINTWDDSFMTFGMFQWTLGQQGNKGELAGLLNRIKVESPETFTEHFGRHGIDVPDATNTTGYISLNGQKVQSTSQKEALRTTGWAFRFWRAGLDPWVQLIQVKHAADRINSFRKHRDYQPLDKYNIGDLITSEYGMCLILDHSVNRPGHLMRFAIGEKDILGQAMKNAGLASTDPTTWTTAEEAKLITAYLPLRAASSMTHGAERAAKITELADAGKLSKERHSFQMPEPNVGSTRSASAAATTESAYPSIDPAEYEARELPKKKKKKKKGKKKKDGKKKGKKK